MTCYSSRYLGEKIHTNHQYEHYLLKKLINKIIRKYEKTKYGKLAPIFTQGYFNSQGYNYRYTHWKGWIKQGELYEMDFFNEPLSYEQLPCIYFDFRYYPNNSNSYEYVTPSTVSNIIRDIAMVQFPPIVKENLKHSSNAKYFKLIIPLYYYKYNPIFIHENRKYNKLIKDNKKYKGILQFLKAHYNLLFNKIYYIPNYEDNVMEYHLRYADNWTHEKRKTYHDVILKELYEYCQKNGYMKEFNNLTIFVTKECG